MEYPGLMSSETGNHRNFMPRNIKIQLSLSWITQRKFYRIRLRKIFANMAEICSQTVVPGAVFVLISHRVFWVVIGEVINQV